MQNITEDMVNHPSHYADHCSIECIDAIEMILGKNGAINFCLGNAIKYIWRCKFKNGAEDLKKANWYLYRLLDNYDCNDLEPFSDKINYLLGIILNLENSVKKEIDKEDEAKQ